MKETIERLNREVDFLQGKQKALTVNTKEYSEGLRKINELYKELHAVFESYVNQFEN